MPEKCTNDYKTGMTKKIIKTPFSTTQQVTNFNDVQIKLVPIITAMKLFLRISNLWDRNTGYWR